MKDGGLAAVPPTRPEQGAREWALWCLTHNLRKLAGVLRTQPITARPALL